MPRTNQSRSIIFTDLDGTLLDSKTYRWDEAHPAIESIQSKNIPLILCSSKTQTEVLFLREAIGCRDPFITENGGGIFIPRGYFKIPLPEHRTQGSYDVIELGVPYSTLRKAFLEISNNLGMNLLGYGDWTINEISKLSGLSHKESARAKQREYDEPFIIKGSQKTVQKVLDRIEAWGLKWTRGGRFFHLTGNHDKGSAVKILTELYRRQEGSVHTIGLGDSPNDLPMLTLVDQSFLLPKPNGSFINIDIPNHQKVRGKGPIGWNRAVLSVLSSHR